MEGPRRATARRRGRGTASAAALALPLAMVAWAGLASPPPTRTVSQRDQAFNPGALAIKRGEAVRIVNDDGDLLHHAYVESKRFSFDSGDQEPGAAVDIVFPVAGTFDVLCGIHPKMRLRVQVD